MSTNRSRKAAQAKPVSEASTDVFAPLPEEVRSAVATETRPQNAREAAGTHLNPRMGVLFRAFRKMNGNISQVKLAKGELTPGVTTTHCQIATLEQGGCKKGADSYTVKLLSEALHVDEAVITAINEADLRERYERGDKLAGKILGVADEADATPDEVASATPDDATPADVPEPASI